MKVLIVDDSTFSAELIKFIIEKENVEYLHAYSGNDAVTMFEKSEVGEINIILMDIVMEDGYGNEAADKIRQLDRADASTVKIYATTAFKAFDFRDKGHSFNGALFKPFERDALNELIK